MLLDLLFPSPRCLPVESRPRPAIERMIGRCLREAANVAELPSQTPWPAAKRYDASTMSLAPATDYRPEQLVNRYVRLRVLIVLDTGARIDAGTMLPVVGTGDGQLIVRLCDRVVVPRVALPHCDLVLFKGEQQP